MKSLALMLCLLPTGLLGFDLGLKNQSYHGDLVHGFGADYTTPVNSGRPGFGLYYDLNLSNTLVHQFRAKYSYLYAEQKTGGQITSDGSQQGFHLTARHFIWKGLYLGLGASYYQLKIAYFREQDSSFQKDQRDGFAANFDIGWQTSSTFYLNAGVSPSIFLDKPDRLLDERFRFNESVEEVWGTISSPSLVYLGLGWFIG